MGVGDRHSRRVLIDKARFAKAVPGTVEVAQQQRPEQLLLDEHDLDDAFSAWDENDAGARKPMHPSQLAQASSAMAKTRVGRKPLAAGPPPSEPAPPSGRAPDGAPPPRDPHPLPARAADPASGPAFDPPSDPALKLVDPVSMHDIVLSRARTIDDPLTTRLLAEIARSDAMGDRSQHARSGLVLLPTAGIVDRKRERIAAELADLIVTDPETSQTDDNCAVGPEDELRVRRRMTRRLADRPKDEPFRKK